MTLNTKKFHNLSINSDSLIGNLTYFFKPDNLRLFLYRNKQLFHKNQDNFYNMSWKRYAFIFSAFLLFVAPLTSILSTNVFNLTFFEYDFNDFFLYVILLIYTVFFHKISLISSDVSKSSIQKYVFHSLDFQFFLQKDSPFFYGYLKLFTQGYLKAPLIGRKKFQESLEKLILRWETDGLTMSVKQDIASFVILNQQCKPMIKFIQNRFKKGKVYDAFLKNYTDYIQSDLYVEPEQDISSFFNQKNESTLILKKHLE